MRYRYLDDFRRGISVFAIFSYGIAVLGTPQCPPLTSYSSRDEFSLLRTNAINDRGSGDGATMIQPTIFQ